LTHSPDGYRKKTGDATDDCVIGLFRSGEFLENFYLAGIHDDKVRECSAGINADPKNRSARHLGRVRLKPFRDPESNPVGRVPKSTPEDRTERSRSGEWPLHESTRNTPRARVLWQSTLSSPEPAFAYRREHLFEGPSPHWHRFAPRRQATSRIR